MEQEELGGVAIGVEVDIQRSNGRIHSALVSGVNLGARSVTVEWFEGGETKGKEVDLESVFRLNGELQPSAAAARPRKPAAAGVPKKAAPPRPTQLTKPVPAAAKAEVEKVASRRNPARQSHVIAPSKSAANGTIQHRREAASADRLADKERNTKPREAMPPPRLSVAETVSKATTSAAAKRRSGVVKEVEKMQVAREKRRAVQAATVEEQERRGREPANPNWEFEQMIDDYKEDLELRPLADGDPVPQGRITVCIRKRPLNSKEKKAKDVDVVTVASRDHVTVHEPKTKVDLTKYLENQQFRFDCAFDESSTNEVVYKYTAKSLVTSIFEGGMATCFAYGQTGSGKTHTMGGEFCGKSQDCAGGIYALAARDVFRLLDSTKHAEKNLVVSCSYFEIYGGKVFDLLSGKSKLKVMEDGKQQVVVVGLAETEVDSEEDVLALISRGNNLRTSGKTSANANSSRSHAVFQIVLRQAVRRRPLHGKFSLIDLAGNERGAVSSSADRQTRLEGAEINKSLLALKECIRALGRKGAHLPFRASKLTQVLRDSFVGEKTRTCMIAMIGPSMSSCEHTLNTLRYADRVKELTVGEGNAIEVTEDEEEEETEAEDMEEEADMMERSGLAQLRSMTENLGEDWLQYQENVARMQQLEEEVVEAHRGLMDGMEVWRQQDAALLGMTNEVDYDQDAYATLLEEMVAEKQVALAALADKARAFRECLAEEEAGSNRRG